MAVKNTKNKNTATLALKEANVFPCRVEELSYCVDAGLITTLERIADALETIAARMKNFDDYNKHKAPQRPERIVNKY